ncbi:MAG: hypothetical protein KAW61_07955 [candidate division Zixibacteria bacterium]|nr:hypothetical protein [candidate division Zixibacteria bacterium]
MKFFKRKKASQTEAPPGVQRLATKARPSPKSPYQTMERIGAMLKMSPAEVRSGRYRTMLYRFLCDNIPVVNSCIWTWSRLAAAPGEFRIEAGGGDHLVERARQRLEELTRHIYLDAGGQATGVPAFLVDLFRSLFRDGIFGGFVTVKSDASGVQQFVPVDSIDISLGDDPKKRSLLLEMEDRTINLSRPDFRHLSLNAGVESPLGQSVLQSVPFVSYIEQQLIDDMRRTSHNAGFHRLHVKINPPERMAGESDNAYTDRINGYFDSTVSMIRSCEVDDNPVTWDNVAIEYIGPQPGRGGTNNWFYNHRAMVEEICAGTHLAPFLLGYSYGDTTTWSAFKFDVVMRQVRSVQAEAAQLLEWIGNIDLALAGLDVQCRFVFDNSFAYQASDLATIQAQRTDSFLKLHQAGLIDDETARSRAGELL